MTKKTQIPIKQSGMELRLDYDVGRVVLDRTIQAGYKDSATNTLITYEKRLQALADVEAQFRVGKGNSTVPPKSVLIEVVNDLMPDGFYRQDITGKQEPAQARQETAGIEREKIGEKYGNTDEHRVLSKLVIDKLRERLGEKCSLEATIRFHSAELFYESNPQYQVHLVQPYVEQLAERAAVDANRILRQQEDYSQSETR